MINQLELMQQVIAAADNCGFLKSGIANHKDKSYLMMALPYLPASLESRKVMGLFACHDNYNMGVDLAKSVRKAIAPLFNVVPKSMTIHCNSKTINEKALAAASGIGIYGKNSLIIVEPWGSFVVLVGLELPYFFDEWQAAIRPKTLCDDCNLCQRACPSNALHQAFRVDRTLCLQSLASNAYLPMSDNLPVIYGCDICQNVCPYNKEATQYYNRMADKYDTEPWCHEDLWVRGDLEEITLAVKKSPLRFGWLNKEALVTNARIKHWSRQLVMIKHKEKRGQQDEKRVD